MKHFTLDEHGTPIPEPDFERWALWYDASQIFVAHDKIGSSVVLTKFLGVVPDDDSGPHLWQTTVIGGILDKVTERCTGNREQAQAMHERILERVRSVNR